MAATAMDAAWRRQVAMEVMPQDFPPARPYERNPIITSYTEEQLKAMRPPRSADSSSLCSRSKSCSGITSLSRSSSAVALRKEGGKRLQSAGARLANGLQSGGASSVSGASHKSGRSSVLMEQLDEERKKKLAAQAEILEMKRKLSGREETPFPLNRMSKGS